MKKKHLIIIGLILTLTFLAVLTACDNEKDPYDTGSEPSQTEPPTEEESLPLEHQLDHRFSSSEGEDVFIPSLWLLYGGQKDSLSINTVTWHGDEEAEDEVILPGYSPLFSSHRLDPIEKTDNKDEAELIFSSEPKEIVICRWSGEYIGMDDKIDEFEEIPLNENFFTIEKNSIYEITAEYENSSASYLLFVE